jgi:hypothetical protein
MFYCNNLNMYNPPVLALLAVGKGGSSSSGGGGGGGSSSTDNDSFRMSLVDDPSSGGRISDAATVTAAGADSSSGSGSGAAADDVDKEKEEDSVGARFVFSISACAEVHVAFDADFTEEWLPVTLHMLQLDLASSFGANAYASSSNRYRFHL